jgi:hypothetical protein
MRSSRLFVAAAFVVSAAAAGAAQTPLTPLETAVGCALPPTLDVPVAQFHVIGVQDVVPRAEFADRDLLVIDGGTAAGIELGQQFFVRRANRLGMAYATRSLGARTLGWIRVVAVNDSTAIAALDHICAPMMRHDYLEPFVAPTVPPGAERDDVSGQPDFDALGQIIAGDEGRSEMGAGDFALIDRGSDQGIAPGARFAVFRDVKAAGMPMASVGEVVVISTSARMALTRITRAQGPLTPGDYVAPRR